MGPDRQKKVGGSMSRSDMEKLRGECGREESLNTGRVGRATV